MKYIKGFFLFSLLFLIPLMSGAEEGPGATPWDINSDPIIQGATYWEMDVWHGDQTTDLNIQNSSTHSVKVNVFGDLESTGTVTANKLVGDGSELTGLTTYLSLDGSNANTNIDIGAYNFEATTITADAGKFSYVDKEEIAEPDTPPADTLRLFVKDQSGFSTYNYKDDKGVVRSLNDDEIVVMNNTDSTIAAHRIVYSSFSVSGIPSIALAKADSVATMPAIGVTIETIASGAYGRAIQTGKLLNVNTNAYEEGTIYVSEVTAGVPTSTAPVTPNLTQEIGNILVKSATIGQIQVIARALTGDEYGTAQNVFYIGDGEAGDKSLIFNGVTNSTITWDGTNLNLTDILDMNLNNIDNVGDLDVSQGSTTLNMTTIGDSLTVDLDSAGQRLNINQTSTVGTEDQSRVLIDDDVVGTTANEVGEASLKVLTAGTYSAYFQKAIDCDGAVYGHNIIPTSTFWALDNILCYWGSSTDAHIRWYPYGDDSLRICTKVNNGAYSGNIDIVEHGESALLINHGLMANPTLNIWNDGATGALRLNSDGQYGTITVFNNGDGMDGVKIATTTFCGAGLGLYNRTTAQLQATIPKVIGEAFWNTDTNELWIATGTLVNQFIHK